MSFWLIDGMATVAEAGIRLKYAKVGDHVLIRLTQHARVMWYDFAIDDIRELRSPADDILGNALKLTERAPTPTLDVGDLTSTTVGKAIIVDGDDVIGITDDLHGLRIVLHQTASPTTAAEFRDTGLPWADDESDSSGLEDENEVTEFPNDRERLIYPYITAPAIVLAGSSFSLHVRLQKTAEGAAGILSVPPTPVTLTVDVIADAFAIHGGTRHQLPIQPGNPSPTLSLDLRAQPTATPILLTTIILTFSIQGVPRGFARHDITICQTNADLSVTSEPDSLPAEKWNLAPATDDPDLTVVIHKADRNAAQGTYGWTFHSPHLDDPPGPASADIGTAAVNFARGISDRIQQIDQAAQLHDELEGIGTEIADAMPEQFWQTLRRVATAVGPRSPTLLIISEEPHVPWELALVTPPLFDETAPGFLGAQTAVGRWIKGRRGPSIPPVTQATIRDMAVIVGDYEGVSGRRNLEHATKEAEELLVRYGGIKLPATYPPLDKLLDATYEHEGRRPATNLLHFACHGEGSDTNTFMTSIVLSTGNTLSHFAFRACKLGPIHQPLIFMNACLIAKTGESLNDASGFSESCLRNHFRAFVGPIWIIDDETAKDIALYFYEEAYRGERIGTIMQKIRRRTEGTRDGFIAATYLAYVFFGHPNLHLERAITAH
ncbi:MAG TPA: TCAD7 domain-containing protein [Thermoanaerobaculia bacterium]|nr:TCAD7 domain-containing protein [Thermoanaerobaculia bacterium]